MPHFRAGTPSLWRKDEQKQCYSNWQTRQQNLLNTMEPGNPASHNESLSLTPGTVPSLQPRHLPHAAILWALAFTGPGLAIILIVPITLASLACLACIALYRLFTQIIDNVLSIWANSPPSNQIVLEAGNLRIEFGCTAEPVPMDFIAEFAASHRDAVERGFAPVFAKEWWWQRGGTGRGRGRLCYAGMRVVEGVGVAVPPFG